MKNTPINNPGRYLKYGSGAYRILCYGRFRRNKPFTSGDYRNFVLNKVSPKRLDANLHALVDCGYLEKSRLENFIKTNEFGYIKYVYQITLSGRHALMVLGEQHRKREEKLQKQHNYNNGLTRWNKERKALRFPVTKN
jgi:DNA-binding PadR family transcriptional regulator